jgi:threonine aldolase
VSGKGAYTEPQIAVDFLSDTVTKPNARMRRAMYEADVGDDVYGEDPTANRLEQQAAQRVGKPAACWLPSGTMANLTAVLSQCDRAQELVVGDESDLYNYEAGGVSVVGGIVLHPVATNDRGEIDLDVLFGAMRDRGDVQCASPGLVALETPHVRRGGIPLSLDYLASVRQFCDAHGLSLHIDGARIFNAAVALRCEVETLCSYATTVQFCLSKSLGAPAGSIVAGEPDVVERVRRWRKLLGGGMRQMGVLAAAGEVALHTMTARLEEDHIRAARLADGLRTIDGIELTHSAIYTNMVFFKLKHPLLSQADLLARLRERGIRMAELAHGNIRAVTHCDLDDRDLAVTLEAIRQLVPPLP